jgi:hypothetical protein
MGDPDRRDPALAGLDSTYEDPRSNPIAFLPVDAASPAVHYAGFTDWPGPPPEPPAESAGEQDHTDPTAFVGEDADPPVNP